MSLNAIFVILVLLYTSLYFSHDILCHYHSILFNRGLVVARSIAELVQDNTFNRGQRPLSAHLFIIDPMKQQVFEVNAAGMFYEVSGGCAGRGMDEGRILLEDAILEFEKNDRATELVNKTLVHMMGKDFGNEIHEKQKEEKEEERQRDDNTDDINSITEHKTDGDDGSGGGGGKEKEKEKEKGVSMNRTSLSQMLRGEKDQLRIITIPNDIL